MKYNPPLIYQLVVCGVRPARNRCLRSEDAPRGAACAVAGGETLLITCCGKLVARLVPASGVAEAVPAAIARMKAVRQARQPEHRAEIRAARDAGRRWRR